MKGFSAKKMKTLLVFDIAFDKRRAKKLKFRDKDEVFVFPLTSSTSALEEVLNVAKICGTGIEVISSGELVNKSAEKLRKKFINFIGAIPELIKPCSENLKYYFKVDNVASLWWFSLVAEKNAYKTNSFNCLAQLDSIVQTIKDNGIDKIIIASRNKKLAASLVMFSNKNKIKLNTISVRDNFGLVHWLTQLQSFFYFKHLILLCFASVKIFIKFARIKIAFKSRDIKTPISCRQMIITYFPNIDINLAAKGIFKNRYYPYLQEVFELKNENLVWIAMYVQGSRISLGKSIEYVKMFIKGGKRIYFLEEFGSIGLQLFSFVFMIKESFRFLKIQKEIEKKHDFDGYNFYSLFKDDWFSSFCGVAGYNGLLYYGCFSKMLQKIKPQKCLYYCEMHAWEKALASAKNKIDPSIRLFAYQHATVSRMLLNYFKDPVEFKNHDTYAMPLPEKIICNGPLTFRYMKESGYPESMLAVAEAIRYNHLKLFPDSQNGNCRNIVLIALSISPKESSSLLSVAYQAFKDMPGVIIWVKPHPFLSTDKVLKEALIDRFRFPFEIKEGNLPDYLKEVRIAIVGESSVALEALASGCHVISVNVPEWINMSPLNGIASEFIKIVSSAGELRCMVEKLLNSRFDRKMNLLSTRKIINDFFYLNNNTNAPEKLLEILEN